MPLAMPPGFPDAAFARFGRLASALFPSPVSDEALNDPAMKGLHFDRAWQAVRYRYRLCAACNDEFKVLLADASELWREWSADEEQNYQLERCIYLFFVAGLSVFESLGFSLYFLGGALRPDRFPHVGKPKQITLKATSKAFAATFPQAQITRRLGDLLQAPKFATIKGVRDILAHRLSGRRNIRTWGTTSPDGTHTFTREEAWSLPGSDAELIFDEGLLQRHLDDVTRHLAGLTEASIEFIEHSQPQDDRS
jgi:hypothetical protein